MTRPRWPVSRHLLCQMGRHLAPLKGKVPRSPRTGGRAPLHRSNRRNPAAIEPFQDVARRSFRPAAAGKDACFKGHLQYAALKSGFPAAIPRISLESHARGQ